MVAACKEKGLPFLGGMGDAELRVEDNICFSKSFPLLAYANWLGLQDHLFGMLD